MKIHIIDSGNFKLDGGAMFGVVPKSLWSRSCPADENNMCSWAMRCLLIEDGDRLILVDTGIGNKQSDKFFGYFYLFGDDTLKGSIEKAGFSVEDITDVFLTHLHFDHCGGAIVRDSSTGTLKPAFPNAKYWSNEDHWQWAVNPNPREKASFLKENILPIQESGQLNFVKSDGSSWARNVFPNIDVFFVNGHTEQQMLPVINYNGQTLIYAADLLPSAHHIPLPYVMGYDVRPLNTLKEKEEIYDFALEKRAVFIFEHDPENQAGLIHQTEKGVRLKETGDLSNYI